MRALPWFIAIVLSLSGCGDDPARSGSGSPRGEEPSERELLPPLPDELERSLAAYFDAVDDLSIAEDEESTDVGARRRFVADSRLRLAMNAVADGHRDGLLPHLRDRVLEAIARGRDRPRSVYVARHALALHREVDGDRDPSLYRELLIDETVDESLRWQAADALISADLEGAAIEFRLLLESGRGPKSLERCFAMLANAAYAELPAILVVGMTSDHRLSRNQAAFDARDHGDARLLSPLRRVAENDPYFYARINAAQSLATLVGTPAIPWLEGLRRRFVAQHPAGSDAHRFVEGFDLALSEARRRGAGPLATDWE